MASRKVRFIRPGETYQDDGNVVLETPAPDNDPPPEDTRGEPWGWPDDKPRRPRGWQDRRPE